MTPRQKVRFYCHGDAEEAVPGSFYCFSCDLFHTKDGFSQHLPPALPDIVMFERGLSALRKHSATYTRPRDAENLFGLFAVRGKY